MTNEPSGPPPGPAPAHGFPWMWVGGAALVAAALVVVAVAVTRVAQAPPSQVDTYRSTVSRDAGSLRASMTMDTDCRALDQTCRGSWARFGAAVDAYQRDLDRNPAPACLQGEDREVRAGLTSYRMADAEFIAALDMGDNTAMTAALTVYRQGNGHIEAAARADQSANC